MTILLQDTFTRADVASGWGTGTDGNAWVLDNSPTGTQDVTTNEGHIVNSGNTTVPDFVYGSSVTTADGDVLARVQFTNTSDEGLLIARRQSAGNYYYAGYDTAASGKQIKKRVTGAGTSLVGSAFTATTSVFYWTRFRIQGSTLSMRMWLDGTSEPGVWDLTVTDSTYTTAGSVGAHVSTSTTNTVSFDHFSLDNLVVVPSSQYVPRALGSTLVNLGVEPRYVPRALGGLVILKVKPTYMPRSLGGTILFGLRGQSVFTPRAMGGTLSFPPPVAPTHNIVAAAWAAYLEALKISSPTIQTKDVLSAKEQAQSQSTFKEAIRFWAVRYVPRVLGGTILLPALVAKARYLEAAKETSQARSTFLEALAQKSQLRAKYLISIAQKAVNWAKYLTSVRFGRILSVPRALGGTLILPSLASRSKFVEAAVEKAQTRSNFLTSIGSKAASRAKYLTSVRFGRVLYVPRALGGTITYPPTGPVAWSKFLVKVPGANAIVGLALSTYKTAIKQSQGTRARFLSAACFGWVRLIPRALGGTIIYPSLSAREKNVMSASEKAPVRSQFVEAVKQSQPARSKFLSRAGMVGLARATFKEAAKSSAQVRAKFTTAVKQAAGIRAPFKIGAAILGRARSAFKINAVLIVVPIKNITQIAVNLLVAVRSQAPKLPPIYQIRAFSPSFATPVIAVFDTIKQTSLSALSTIRSLPLSYVPRALGGTLLNAINRALTIVGVQTQLLTISHQGVLMPAPFSSILSTITVTDVNGALVSNASAVSVLATYPDDSTSALSLGSGVTNIGNGQYQAKYNTKASGMIREVWSITAADGVTIGSSQFLVGVEY